MYVGMGACCYWGVLGSCREVIESFESFSLYTYIQTARLVLDAWN